MKRAPKGAVPRWVSEVALTWARDDCLLWPFGISGDGYGMATVDGKSVKAHRVVCIEAHGPAPENRQVAHSCGKPTCVNPRHLRWATNQENQDDRIIHGTTLKGESHPSAKLNAAQVIAIRAARGKYEDIAGRYGVCKATVSHIKNNRIWKSL